MTGTIAVETETEETETGVIEIVVSETVVVEMVTENAEDPARPTHAPAAATLTEETRTHRVECTENESARNDTLEAGEMSENGIVGIVDREETIDVMMPTAHPDGSETCSRTADEEGREAETAICLVVVAASVERATPLRPRRRRRPLISRTWSVC